MLSNLMPSRVVFRALSAKKIDTEDKIGFKSQAVIVV